MKRLIIPVLFITGASQISKAQTLQDAIRKTENERFSAAATDFRSLIAKEPTKGDNYFYFGENYFNNDDLDSALIMYKKGSEVQPTNGLNFIGIGKVHAFQGNTNEANTNLFKGKTLGAKNNVVLIELASVYINAPVGFKNPVEATKILADVLKHDSKNVEAHILMGDALLEQNPTEGGPAIKEYEEALKLNQKSPKAVLREGKLYQRGRNYQLALDYYKKAIGMDPNFAPAYREMAEIYHLAKQDDKAIESMKKYIELNNSSDAHRRYASFMFMDRQYSEVIREIEDIIQKDNSDPYMYRLLGYSYYELGDKTDKDAYTKGLAAMQQFFKMTEGKKFKYITDDYKYMGVLLSKTGQDSLAVLEYEKAIAQDEAANCDLYSDIAKSYMKDRNYDKAIEAYEKKVKCGKTLNGQDYYDEGRAYYYGPKDFVNADSCFSRLTQSNPAYPVGYFWRAKANVQLDPKLDKFLAKPYYEKGLELVKPEERTTYKSNVVEACSYLGYYYVVTKDYAKAKEYWGIVRELEPNNQKAIDFFKSPQGK